ncbi:MAG: DUF362 domain-containing protein [bacterium]
MKITRRQFLKTSAVVGVGVGLGVWKPWDSLAIQSPSYDDIPVAVVKDPLATAYPATPPFHPPEIYPEYPYPSREVDVTNRVYPMVREALRLLNPNGFGTSSWNPLGNLIDVQHQKILIKPNFCGQIGVTDYTEASVLRVIIDYTYLALRQAGVNGIIIVGDGADTPDGFWPITNSHGLKETADMLRGWGVPIDLKDMNYDTSTQIDIFSSGACEYSLDSVSPPPAGTKWKGPNRDILSPGVYTFTNTPLGVDVIINVPKMKNHAIAGVTLSLKNFLGLLPPGKNGIYKDCPHQCNYDEKWNPPANDTIWRGILDINKIALYYRNGFQSTRQRNYMSIVDGIIGMEGKGPHWGPPKISSCIIAGYDPVSVDTVASRVMGMDWTTIQQLFYGDRIRGRPLGPADSGIIDVRMSEGSSLAVDYPAATAYATTWVGQSLSDFTPPEVAASHENRTVQANVVEADSEIKRVDLYCKLALGETTKIPMARISGDSKNGVFEATMPGDTVKYYVKAVDTFFNDGYSMSQPYDPGGCQRRKRGEYYR